MSLVVLYPDWPVAGRVRAAMTGRDGGVSVGAFSSLNVATHVGDSAAAVAENRQRLHTKLAMPSEPLWLQQVHGVAVCDADGAGAFASPAADAAIARRAGTVLAIQVADCMPVL